MKKKQKRVRRETEAVERVKCDDCGLVDSRSAVNTLALNPRIAEKGTDSFGNSVEITMRRWGRSIYTGARKALGYAIMPEEYLDLCDSCLEKHECDPEEHEKDEIDRQLEREHEGN